MRVRVAVLLFCVAIALAASNAAETAGSSGLQPGELAVLHALVGAPSSAVISRVAMATPSARDTDLFDRAFETVRAAVLKNPHDGNLRSNLGALYLWRPSFHTDEGGNFQRAIDQFLIALRYDRANAAALTYLGNYAVFSRIPRELPTDAANRIESALRNSLIFSRPLNPLPFRTLVVWWRFKGLATPALGIARVIDQSRPNEPASKIFVGAMGLAALVPADAQEAFNASLKLSPSKIELATAQVGLAQAALMLGDLDGADRWLQEFDQQSSPELESGLRDLGLSTPAELGSQIAKAFFDKGQPERAILYMEPDDLLNLSVAAAIKKNHEGFVMDKAHDLEGARLAYFSATELDPSEPVFWHNAARASFQLGHYQDAVVAFGRAAAPTPPGYDALVFSDGAVSEYALSYAVLGDYKRALELFEGGAKDFPSQDYLAWWAIDVSYGVGGWDEALATWSRIHGRESSWQERFDIWIHIRNGLWDLAERAEKRGSIYLSLLHESLLYRADGDGLQRVGLSEEGRRLIFNERKQTLNKIINAYRSMPVKPALGSDVQSIIQNAQPLLTAAFTGDNQRGWVSKNSADFAMDRYYLEATERAPWWPEGHYMLALLACRNPRSGVPYKSSQLFGPLTNHSIYAWEFASQEIETYLALVPESSAADEAREAMRGCVTQ